MYFQNVILNAAENYVYFLSYELVLDTKLTRTPNVVPKLP